MHATHYGCINHNSDKNKVHWHQLCWSTTKKHRSEERNVEMYILMQIKFYTEIMPK